MTFQKGAFVNFLILMIAFNEVATWTIDLPEVRRFLFEKNEKHKHESKNEYEDYLSNDQKFYSNIEGNSKHHSDYEHEHHDNGKEKYADEYGYHSYMEKKVHHIVRDGSAYLEGLRRSLEDYSTFLESCNRRNSSGAQNSTSGNSTAWRPQYEESNSSSSISSSASSSNSTDNTGILTFENYDNSTVPLRPRVNSSDSRRPGMRSRSNRRMSCDEATEASEQVRRYADLALWATGRLQDLTYAKKYQKTDEQEENELILKLAWFLDRLAYLSGYEPDYKDHEMRGTRRPTTEAPTAQTLVPSSDEMNKEMMDCLKRNSSEPATVRCRYTMQMPDLTARMLNINSERGTTPSSSDSVIPMSSDNVAEQSSEILITADDSTPNGFQRSPITKRSTEYTYYYPHKPLHELSYPVPIVKLIKHRLSNIKSIVKTIVEKRLAHIAEKKEEKQHYEKHFEKRSIDDSNQQTSNYIKSLSSAPKSVDKSIEKRPIYNFGNDVGVIHYPVSDVSVINTKSFKKRSIDDRKTLNKIKRLSNFKSVEKGPLFRKKFENFLSFTKSMKRLSKGRVSGVKSIKKRFTEDPLTKFTNYYIKYKVWDNSNPLHTKNNFNKTAGIFDVKNNLNEPKTIKKRSLFNKKVIHMHMPKPLQIVRTHVHGHRHHHDFIQKTKLLTHLQKLHDLKHKKLEKLHKKTIKKRSIHYEDMYLPRTPMDPQGDISYYVKNKEGTNFNRNPVQAAQVRLGLEQVFQTGNIEVVRRFGSNYNPLNPAPLYTGALQSYGDA